MFCKGDLVEFFLGQDGQVLIERLSGYRYRFIGEVMCEAKVDHFGKRFYDILIKESERICFFYEEELDFPLAEQFFYEESGVEILIELLREPL